MLYRHPYCSILSNRVSQIVSKGNPTLGAKKISAYIMPIQFQIKTFFELPGVLDCTLRNTELLLSKTKICNYVNLEIHQQTMSKFGNKIVLPMFVYFDDYGINNPLGSHSKSIFAGYYHFPTVPRYLTSKLNFIFNFVFVNSADYKRFGNEVSLHHVVVELENLEKNGVTLNISGSIKKVFFTLGAVLGDNLGLNSVLGFTRSFNSHSFCRSCRRKKVDTKRDCI